MSIQQSAESEQRGVHLILNEPLQSFINTALNLFRVRNSTRVFALVSVSEETRPGSQRKIYDWHIESLFGAREVFLNAH